MCTQVHEEASLRPCAQQAGSGHGARATSLSRDVGLLGQGCRQDCCICGCVFVYVPAHPRANAPKTNDAHVRVSQPGQALAAIQPPDAPESR